MKGASKMTGYRICTHCGTKWLGDVNICPKCGVGLAWVNEVTPKAKRRKEGKRHE